MTEILVPETPIKDSKLQRLMQIFGSSRSESVLSKALKNANGELELAIMYAAVEPPEEVNISVQEEQPLKRKKLVKKKDLHEPYANITEITDLNDIKKRKLIKKKDIEVQEIKQVIQISSDEEEIEQEETDSSEDEEAEENTFEAATVLYFNSCADEQLMETTGCCLEDATFITSQRPFSSFKQLQESLKIKRRYVTILDRYVDMMNGFAKVDHLIQETKVYGDDINVISLF
jgi:hypothetical protein